MLPEFHSATTKPRTCLLVEELNKMNLSERAKQIVEAIYCSDRNCDLSITTLSDAAQSEHGTVMLLFSVKAFLALIDL